MTNEEFSNEFDSLLNSYNSQSQFGDASSKLDIVLDEYEKSVFLTQAQEEIIMSLYSGTHNNEYFESTEKMRKSLNQLVKTNILNKANPLPTQKLSSKSIFYSLPDDLWLSVYEAGIIDSEDQCLKDKHILVVPTTHDTYFKSMQNPFRRSNKRRVLRLDLENNIIEVISDYILKEYLIRYISKPSPIILVDLPNDLSINGENTIKECTLNPIVHRDILNRAIQLAIISKTQLLGNKK